jgi:hypothetical protein
MYTRMYLWHALLEPSLVLLLLLLLLFPLAVVIIGFTVLLTLLNEKFSILHRNSKVEFAKDIALPFDLEASETLFFSEGIATTRNTQYEHYKGSRRKSNIDTHHSHIHSHSNHPITQSLTRHKILTIEEKCRRWNHGSDGKVCILITKPQTAMFLTNMLPAAMTLHSTHWST